MSGLIFVDSFDHYDTGDLSRKWTSYSNTVVSTAGRNGSCINCQGSVFKSTKYMTTTVVGFAFKISSLSASTRVVSLTHQASIVMSLILGADNLLYITTQQSTTIVYNGGINAVSKTDIKANTWYFIELTCETDVSGGQVRATAGNLYINGGLEAVYAPASPVGACNSVTGAVGGVNGLSFGGSINYNTLYDDVYWRDDTTVLGDCPIGVIRPNGTGASALWTGTGTATGSGNWDTVNDQTPDDTDGYVYTSTVGDLDIYNFEDISSADGTVKGIQLNIVAWKDDEGDRALRPVMIVGTTTTTGTDDMWVSYKSWVDYRQCWDFDPETSTWFTDTAINNGQWGFVVQT